MSAREAGVNELGVKLLRILGEIQDAVDIAAAVVEGREQESSHRSLYPPVPGALLDGVGRLIVGETGLGKLYRADAAEDVVVDFLGCVEHFLIVGRFSRHIVGAVDQDNIVVFAVLVIFDYLIIKGIHGLIVGELLIAEFHEKLVGAVRTFVVDRVLQVVEILSDSAGQGFLEDLIIFEDLLLGQGKERLLQGRLDLLFRIDITSADAGDGVVVLLKLFLNF